MKNISIYIYCALTVFVSFADFVFAQECAKWTTVANIGGVVEYEPAIMAEASGKLVIAVVSGKNEQLWINEFNPANNQNEWYSLGGLIYASPALRQTKDNKIITFCVGKNNIVWTRILQSAKNWTDWQQAENSTSFIGTRPDRVALGGYLYRAVKESDDSVKIEKCSVITDVNNARFISQNIPKQMEAGENYFASVIMENIGTSDWDAAGNYRLGLQNSQGDSIWGEDKIFFSDNESIAFGDRKTFEFSVQAPVKPGTYNFQSRMIQDGLGWFGEKTANVTVSVIVSPCTDQCLAVGQKKCVGDGVSVCGDYNTNSCLEWSPVVDCAKGEFCDNGFCIEKNPAIASCSHDWCSVAGIQSFQILKNPTGDNPKYYMFFESSDQDEGHHTDGGIGLATSNNLVDWSMSGNNPVIVHDYGAWDPTILYEDGVWKCWNSQTDPGNAGWHTGYFTTANNVPDSGWKEHPESPVISSGSHYENRIVKDKNIYYLYRSGGSRKQSIDGIHFTEAGTHNIPDRLGDVYKEGDIWYAFNSAPAGKYPDDNGIYVDWYKSFDGINFTRIERIADVSDFSFINGPSDGAVVHDAVNNHRYLEAGNVIFFHAGDMEWGIEKKSSNRKLYFLKDRLINNDPKGYLESINCEKMTGWACDADDYSKAIAIHFYDGGFVGQGGKFIGSTTADLVREPTVGNNCGSNNNHGFSFIVPAVLKDGESHKIYAYAINIPSGNNPLLNAGSKTITCTLSCEPKTCVVLGDYRCGIWDDGCGSTIGCGVCASGETCSNGQCVSNCASHMSKKCVDGNLYWYNSCGHKEELAQLCETKGKICQNGQCIEETDKIDTEESEQISRAEILQKIAEIRKILMQLIIELIAKLQEQLGTIK